MIGVIGVTLLLLLLRIEFEFIMLEIWVYIICHNLNPNLKSISLKFD